MLSSSLLWLLVATALWLLVLVGVDSDGLLLVGGSVALLLALSQAALPLPVAAQAVLFLGLVALSYGAVRRWLSRGKEGASLLPSARAEEAEVIAGFAADGRGRVRWQGQSWAARSLDSGALPSAGQRVTVMGREGNCLQVMARPRGSESTLGKPAEDGASAG
ncbi:MAG: NfeD family protein [Cyanobacteriota bacterium]|jgi:membrane protein implicated in regulation of membrane protease activity